MAYETMEVGDGAEAGLAWARLIEPATTEMKKGRLAQALIEYCKQDTLALAKLFDVLCKYSTSDAILLQ
jgi:hypothetical protein